MTADGAPEGVILKGVGGLYYARAQDGAVYVLRARGKFRHQRLTPLVGDRVRFLPGQGEEHGWVEEILPRESTLVRPPVANIRHMLLVLAPAPAPDLPLALLLGHVPVAPGAAVSDVLQPLVVFL